MENFYGKKPCLGEVSVAATASAGSVGDERRGRAEFHEIVSALETAFEIDLSRFRIPDSEMKQYAVSMHRRSQYGRFRAKTRLTDVRYCDDELVLKQVAGIAKRMHTLVQSLDMLRVAA